MNAIYISGGFSTDTTVKADFLTIASSAAGVPTLGLTNIVVAPNLNYKFDYMRCWVEPTVGASYTDTSWNGPATAFGFTHGHQWRVQGGVRFGTSWDWYGVRVDPVLGLFAYSDVEVQGGTLAAAVATPLVPTDQGKVFGQLTGKLGFDWGRGWTSYVEGEVRGRNQVWGAAGRVGFAYAFVYSALSLAIPVLVARAIDRSIVTHREPLACEERMRRRQLGRRVLVGSR